MPRPTRWILARTSQNLLTEYAETYAATSPGYWISVWRTNHANHPPPTSSTGWRYARCAVARAQSDDAHDRTRVSQMHSEPAKSAAATTATVADVMSRPASPCGVCPALEP